MREKESVQWTVSPKNDPATVFAQDRFGLLVTMGGEVVEDHGRAGFDLGDQYIADVGDKGGTAHRLFDDLGCDQIGGCQPRDQGPGLP